VIRVANSGIDGVRVDFIPAENIQPELGRTFEIAYIKDRCEQCAYSVGQIGIGCQIVPRLKVNSYSGLTTLSGLPPSHTLTILSKANRTLLG
jgi:hypothetical protein